MVERKKEKHTIVINLSNLGASQLETLLVGPTEQRTHTRVVGNISITKDSSAASGSVAMAIVIVREGQSTLALSLANGTALYPRPQDVLWHQFLRMPVDADTQHGWNIHVDVLGKRILEPGDAIRFAALANLADTAQIGGSLTLFLLLP